MKKMIRFTAPLIAVALMSIAPAFVRAQDSAKTNQSQNVSTEAWNTPPAGTEQSQQGYRDGVQALQLDMAAKRTIDAKVSHLYVHPPVRGAARDEYRASFTAGYEAAKKHTTAGGGGE
ncbi:hypothetical protein [Granulicella sp. dw_53]|uniref:hypothetical protein n=1 Tax=Granulicella sp. dw_53 TaxID=2719792 RepID=UPI001BD6A5E7|nr:hypothetical protein [Granulicella sp. dw_53]